MVRDDGDGSMSFHDYEGGGIGEGEGTKDISDKIENEDQVRNTNVFIKSEADQSSN